MVLLFLTAAAVEAAAAAAAAAVRVTPAVLVCTNAQTQTEMFTYTTMTEYMRHGSRPHPHTCLYTHTPGSPSSPSLVGKTVVITGTSREDLNGRTGHVFNFIEASGRYSVELEDGVCVKLKPEKLIISN